MNKFRALAGVFLFCAGLGWGQTTFTWTGLAGDDRWDSPYNWYPHDPDAFPGYNLAAAAAVNGDVAKFESPYTTVTVLFPPYNPAVAEGDLGTVVVTLGPSVTLTLESKLPSGTELNFPEVKVIKNSKELTIAGKLKFDGTFQAELFGTKDLALTSDAGFTLEGYSSTNAVIKSAGPIAITAAGDMAISGVVASTGTGDLSLEAAGTLAINDEIKTTGTGAIALSAEEINVKEAITGTGNITLDADKAITIDGAIESTGTAATVAVEAGETIRINKAITGAGAVSLTAADAISQTDPSALITAVNLTARVTATGDVTLNVAENMVDKLSVAGSGSGAVDGDVYFKNRWDLTIGPSSGDGIKATGEVTITTVNGDITVSKAVVGNDITLIATEKITVNEAITGTGNVSLTAKGAATAGGISGNGVITAANLNLASDGPISLGTTANMVDKLSVTGSGSGAVNGNVSFKNGQDLVIGISGDGIKATGTVDIAVADNRKITVGEAVEGETITLAADDIELNEDVTADAGSGTVKILNKTANREVYLGGTTSGSYISLSAAEIANISAATLEIGGNNTGDITINDNITFPIPTVFTTGASITQTGGKVITAAALTMDAAGVVDLNGSAHAVTTLEVRNSSGVNFANSRQLTIAGIASTGTVSLTTTTDGITQTVAISGTTLTAQTAGLADLALANSVAALQVTGSAGVNFKNARQLTIDGITSTGNVALTTTTGGITQTASGAITAANLDLISDGSITLEAPDNNVANLAATGYSSGVVDGVVNFTNKRDLTIGISGKGINARGTVAVTTETAGDITVAEAIVGGAITLTAAKAIAVNEAITGTAPGTKAVSLTAKGAAATGGITQAASGAITAANLDLISDGSITLEAPDNNVANLAATGYSSGVVDGVVNFTNKRDLSIGIAGKGINAAGAVAVTTGTNGSITLEQAVNAVSGNITLEAVKGIVQKAAISGSTVTLHKTGNTGGLTQTAGSVTAALLEIKGSYNDPLELLQTNHVAKIRAAGAGVSVAFKNELQETETLEIDTVNGGRNTVAIAENKGSIKVTGAITAAAIELTAKKDIHIEGADAFDQADAISFALGGAMSCADAISINANELIAIRPFDPLQTIYVSMSGGPGDVSIPQGAFDKFNAPLVILDGRDVHIGSLKNGSSAGYDIEMSAAASMYVEGNVEVIGAAGPERNITLRAERLAMKPDATISPHAAAGSNIHITLEINRFEADRSNRIAADHIQLCPIGAAEGKALQDIQYGDADIPDIMPKDGSNNLMPYVYYSSLWDVLYADQYIVGHENYNGDIYVSGVGILDHKANYILEARNKGSIYFYGAYLSNNKTLNLQSGKIFLLNTAEIDVGSAEKLTIEKDLIVQSSGVSLGDTDTSITGSGRIEIAGGVTGTDGVSFTIDNRGGNEIERYTSINGPLALDGVFTYRGESLVIGSGVSGGPLTGVTAPGIVFDAPRVKGNIAFDGDLGFVRDSIEFTGHIVNKNKISAGAEQKLFFGGNYSGESGSLLVGAGGKTEIHFRQDAEFRGDPPGGYQDHNGSWLVFSGGKVQQFNSGGKAFGNIRIDKDGGELRLAGNDVTQRGDAVLEIANGLLNLASGTGSGGAGRRGWTLGASGAAEPARNGNFAGLAGTLRLINSLGTGAELRAMDLVLGENFALSANNTGINTLAALGNISIGKNNKNFGTARVEMIPGSAAERTRIASEAVLYKLVVLRPARLAGNIALTEMELGSTAVSSGVTLDGGSSVIRVLGNWTNHIVDVDRDGVSRSFVYGTSTVIFDRTSNSDKAIAIRGGSAWHAFVCESPGAVIQFDNYPRRHYVAARFKLAGAAGAGGHITLARLNNTGQPARRPPDTTQPALPLTDEDHKNYWDFVMQSAINGSGGTKIDLEHTIITYSNANLRIPTPPKEKDVLAHPFYSRDNPSPPLSYPGADYERYSYYNINWVVRHSFAYVFTEDADGNGRIDRIRAQAAYELNSNDSGAFNKLSVRVMKNDKASDEWIKVKGYGAAPGSPDSIYIYLEEHDYADGGAGNLVVDIVNNESLMDLATGLSLVKNPDSEDGPLRTTDTVFPRVTYALMLPRSKEGFVQFSEGIDHRSMQFEYPENRIPGFTAVDSERNNEFVLSFAGDGYGVKELAAGPLFTVTGINDGAAFARDKNEDDPDYPSPKYPVDWKYSGYVVVPGNPPDISRSYRIIPGDLGSPASGNALAPPNALPGGTFAHRVTDLLVANGPGNHFAAPVWAMNSQETVGANQGAHVVRVFYGGDYLEDKDITLEVNVHPDLKDDYTPEFIFGSAIPASCKVGSSPVDPEFGVPHGIAGLWLPNFVSKGYDAGQQNVYAFSNIVAKPYLSAFFVGRPDAAGGGNFDFRLKKNIPGYTYAGISMLEFFLRLAPNRGENPASGYLYAGQLGRGSPWYRHVEPFKFELHNITRQRGGVTILNNVIKPSRGETVYVDYTLPRNGPVTIQVFTLDGNLVKALVRENKAAGEYRAGWDGKNNGGREVARGLYFIRVVAPDIDEIRKVMVVR